MNGQAVDPESFEVGLGDYWISEGTHICALYSSSAERDAMLRSYVRSALRSGDKCICILAPAEAPQMMQVITSVDEDDDVDLSACLSLGQLDLVGAPGSVNVERFSAAEKIGMWKVATAGSMNAAHYRCIRAIGDVSSSLRDAPLEREVILFESELNNLLPLYPQVMVCMYDLSKVGGSVLVDLVSTHPKLLVKGMLVENPYYLTPEKWLTGIGAWA
jgi:hypothetical protein